MKLPEEKLNKKALVDYTRWIMKHIELFEGESSLYVSYGADVSSSYLSEKSNKAFEKAKESFLSYWDDVVSFRNTLMDDMKMTQRERELLNFVFEYLILADESFTWNDYLKEFKRPALKRLNEGDLKFINFWGVDC